jgi:hypothetical protein
MKNIFLRASAQNIVTIMKGWGLRWCL